MRGQVTEDDDGSGCDLRDQHLADVGGKGRTVHCALDRPRCDQRVRRQSCDQGLRAPAAKRRIHGQPLSAWAPTAEAREVRLHGGFFSECRDVLTPLVEISLWNDLLICADPPTYAGAGAVYGFSETTEHLDTLRIERETRHAVDVGSGSGALALRMATLAKEVTTIDVNPRAVAFTKVNALLNGIDNLNASTGDLLSSIAPGSADLILGNLPFVISPDRTYLYRDGTVDSQEMMMQVVRQAELSLTEGGMAQFLCSWPISNEAPPGYEPWLEDLACDSIVIGFSKDTPKEHAETWLTPEAFASRDAYRSSVRRWVRWLEEAGIESVASGILYLRVTSAVPTRTYFDAAAEPRNRGGLQIMDMFLSADLPRDWNELSGLVLNLVPHSLYQRLAYTSEGYTAREASILATDSAGVSVFCETGGIPHSFRN